MADERLLSTVEAARRLGVKPQTVYAYVSRGLLHSRRGGGYRGSTFSAEEVEQLAAHGRAERLPIGAVEKIRTAITALDGDQLHFRGRSAVELATTSTFEEVAELLWDCGHGAAVPWEEPPADLVDAVRAALRVLPATARLSDELRVGVAVLAAADPARSDSSPTAVTAAARTVLGVLARTVGRREEAVPGSGPAPDHGPGAGRAGVAAHLWRGLTGRAADADAVDLLGAALVLMADHGLAVSTLAARVTASAGGDVYAVLSAGLAAGDSAHHAGAASEAHELLLAAAGDPAGVLARREGEGGLPGFGHAVYRSQDPRAELLLRLLPDGPAARTADALCLAMAARPGLFPSVDLALGALTAGAGMDPSAAEAVFLYARIAGWVAHALEEHEQSGQAGPTGLRYRALGVYTGDPPRARG